MVVVSVVNFQPQDSPVLLQKGANESVCYAVLCQELSIIPQCFFSWEWDDECLIKASNNC